MSRMGLSREEHAAMISRALSICPGIDDDEAVMTHIHSLGLSVSSIGAVRFDALLDEARTTRRGQSGDTFTSLGDAASAVVAKLPTPKAG